MSAEDRARFDQADAALKKHGVTGVTKSTSKRKK